VNFPNFSKISQAFDLPYQHIMNHSELTEGIRKTLAEPGPAVCEIMLDENISFAPKLGAKQHPDGRITSPPLEDLSPFLPRDVFKENMIIELVSED
jgi:acetolactate synthase-1/2/3 large subunit